LRATPFRSNSVDPRSSCVPDRVADGVVLMADETQAGAAYAASGATNPWLVALVVAFAAFMEVLDTTIVNVALPHVAGGLGVSVDEASWVVTTYLIANAAALVASPFFGRWLGRKTFFITCLALFTAASVACGFAWNLEVLLDRKSTRL